MLRFAHYFGWRIQYGREWIFCHSMVPDLQVMFITLKNKELVFMEKPNWDFAVRTEMEAL